MWSPFGQIFEPFRPSFPSLSSTRFLQCWPGRILKSDGLLTRNDLLKEAQKLFQKSHGTRNDALYTPRELGQRGFKEESERKAL